MSEAPTGGRRGGGGGAALLAGVIILLGPWAVIILAVGAFDLDYIIQTARAIQDLIVSVLIGVALFLAALAVLALAAGGLGVRYLFHRTDGEVVRAELGRRAAERLAAAENSRYPNLTTFTHAPRYDTRHAVAGPADLPALPAPGAPPALPAAPPGQLLVELRRRGLICGNPRLLSLGLQGDQSVVAQIGKASMVAIGGNPRMGKSTLAVWLISQAAMMGWQVYLCDPHGDEPEGQSILGRLQPVAHLLARAAVTPEEMAEAVATFDALGERRLHGGDGDRTPALLVIDELPALALSGQLPPATMETLIRIGSQYPKVSLLMVGIGYDWSAGVFNSSPYAAPLRRLSLPRVTVNADPNSAGKLLGSMDLGRQARDLSPGQALYVAAGGYGVIDVPQVSPADLTAVVSSCPTPPEAPPVVLDLPALGVVAGETLEAGPPPLRDRILTQVRAAGPQTSRALADSLGEDINQVCARLDELVAEGHLSRSGSKKRYLYALAEAFISQPRGG